MNIDFSFHTFQTLRKYATEWIVNIHDVTDFVREQSTNIEEKRNNLLEVARERVYPVTDPQTAALIGLGDCWRNGMNPFEADKLTNKLKLIDIT